MKKCLILANGDAPKKSVIKYLQKSGYTTLICADGGANTAYKLNLIPDYIIGDFDSINKETIDFFTDKVKFIQLDRQNDTDVEKALKLAISKKYSEVILLGATGDRLDHSFCNIGVLLKFSDKINTAMLHQKSFMKVYNKSTVLRTIHGEVLSIYGIDHKTKITSSGLKYSLKNDSLPFGVKESTSNVAIADTVKINISGGKILIVRDYEVLKRNDFFRLS